MKKYIIFALLLFIPSVVFATPGGLQKASIKTCPDGVVYGKHNSNGIEHWHKAVVATDSWSGWTAEGDPLAGDPCPTSSQNVVGNVQKTTRATTAAPVRTTTTTTTTTTTEIVTEPIEETTTVETTIEVTTEAIQKNIGNAVQKDDNKSDDTAAGIVGLIFMGGVGYAVYKGVTKKRK